MKINNLLPCGDGSDKIVFLQASALVDEQRVADALLCRVFRGTLENDVVCRAVSAVRVLVGGLQGTAGRLRFEYHVAVVDGQTLVRLVLVVYGGHSAGVEVVETLRENK